MNRFPESVVLMMAAIVLACASPAFAAGLACVLEGDFELAGQRVVINDCAESHRLPEPEFRRSCEAMGNPLQDDRYKATITYTAQCPAAVQATCKDAMGGAMDFHYYRRDAALLESTQASCEAMGGTWSR